MNNEISQILLDQIREIDARDESQILSEIAGEQIREMFYVTKVKVDGKLGALPLDAGFEGLAEGVGAGEDLAAAGHPGRHVATDALELPDDVIGGDAGAEG